MKKLGIATSGQLHQLLPRHAVKHDDTPERAMENLHMHTLLVKLRVHDSNSHNDVQLAQQ